MKPKELKAIRKDLGMNKTEFAKMVGVSVGIISYFESGKRNMSPRMEKLIIEKVETVKNGYSISSETLAGLKNPEHSKKIFNEIMERLGMSKEDIEYCSKRFGDKL